MPESRIVPGGRALRPVPLPDGALEDIQLRARRRRAGRAAALGSAGATALALVAVTVVVGGADGSDDSLRIGPAQSVSPAPAQLEPSVPPVPEPSAAARAAEVQAPGTAIRTQPRPAAPARPEPRAAGAPVPVVQEAQEAAPARPDRRRYDPDAIWSSDTILTIPPECESTGRGSFAGWCLAALTGDGVDRILVNACRVRGAGAGRLDWVNSQRLRLEVRDASGKRVWSYDPRIRQERASHVVPADSCVGWEVPYAVVDEAGEPLAPGDYTLIAGTTAQVIDGFTVDSAFSVPSGDEPLAAPASRLVPPPTVPRVR